MTGSAGFVGLVAFLNFFPTLFVSPLFGVFADRIDIRKGSIFSYALAGTLSGLFAVMCILAGPTPLLLALFSFVTGVISSANHPMRMSLTPRLAPTADLPSVVAITSLNFNMSRLTGPVIGGLLIQLTGASIAFAITAATYAAPVIAIYFMRPRDRARTNEPPTSGYINQLVDGCRYALGKSHLRVAIIFGVSAPWPRPRRSRNPANPRQRGFRPGAVRPRLHDGGGRRGSGRRIHIQSGFKTAEGKQFEPHILAMPVVIPLLVASFAMIDDFGTAVGAVALIGASVTLLAISLQSTVQMAIEDRYRGRVMGLWTTISIGSGALGAVLMGVLVDMAGPASAPAFDRVDARRGKRAGPVEIPARCRALTVNSRRRHAPHVKIAIAPDGCRQGRIRATLCSNRL